MCILLLSIILNVQECFHAIVLEFPVEQVLVKSVIVQHLLSTLPLLLLEQL